MIEDVWMDALETALYIPLKFREGSTDRSRRAAFYEFLKSPRAYGFPEPDRRMGHKRPIWSRAQVDVWKADRGIKKQAKARLLENPPQLTGAVKANMYREPEPAPEPQSHQHAPRERI